MLAAALADPDCPLFVLSTVRADFLDRFGEGAPELTRVLNQVGKRWTLASIGEAGLREMIDGPARLAGLNVDEVREAMLAEACGEPGALPLVENGLDWLWQRRDKGRLSGRLFTEQGGLAASSADRQTICWMDWAAAGTGVGATVPAGQGGFGGRSACSAADWPPRGDSNRRRR